MLRRLMLAAALCMAALAGVDRAAAFPQGALERDNLNVAGTRRSYLLYAPESIPASRPASLVLVFHGGFGRGADLARRDRLGMNAVADRAGFSKRAIDPRRIYATGLSNGGYFTGTVGG